MTINGMNYLIVWGVFVAMIGMLALWATWYDKKHQQEDADK